MGHEKNGNDSEWERVLAGIAEFAEFAEFARVREDGAAEAERPSCGLEGFTLLLSGVSSCRRVPGIDGPGNLGELYICDTEDARNNARQHLSRMYGVTDEESLKEVCEAMFHAGEEYTQFLSFWNGEPAFDLEELNEHGREAFDTCKAFAEQLRAFVGSKGLHAWDCNEQVGLCRNAVACGIIKEGEFFELCFPRARRMAAIYDSFGEYAVSCLCGAVYFMYCESGWSVEGLKGFLDINRNILTHLLSEDGEWSRNGWLRLVKKDFAIGASEIKELLIGWEEAEGCFATDRIMVDGCKVGYMYREEPSPGMPDSGWRFFAGDESDEYANDTDNVGVYHLNTLCNYAPDILPLLHAPYNTAYFRDEDGMFQQEALVADGRQ